jgi:TetR/AcrR family transcriptional regulator, transcriptional repressor for nem operon
MPRTSDARERIVRAGAKLFLERSYHGVGIDEICAAADVRKGSFYYHFASKADLGKAVIDHHAAAFLGTLGEVSGTPVERLHAVADAIGATQTALEGHFGRVVGCPFGNLAAELATTDEELRVHVAAVFDAMERGIAGAARDAADAGLLRPGVDPAWLARTLVAQYQGAVLLAKVSAGGVDDLAPALHRVIDANLLAAAA